MRFASVQASLVFVTISAILAQQESNPPPAPSAGQQPLVLKAATRLVQVSVIAQDGKGQPVTDLHKDDFRIKVNGKDQPIKVFSMDSSGALPQSPWVFTPTLLAGKLIDDRFQEGLEGVGKAYRAGVPIIFGTDLGIFGPERSHLPAGCRARTAPAAEAGRR